MNFRVAVVPLVMANMWTRASASSALVSPFFTRSMYGSAAS